MNLIIYIGLIIFVYISDYLNNKSRGDGIVDLFVICISFILIIVLCVLNSINKNKELIAKINSLESEITNLKGMNKQVQKNKDKIKLIIANINLTPIDKDDDED